MEKLRDRKAFTIIELIVVIAILGILVLLGLPRLAGYAGKAQLVRIQHDTKIMQDKMEEVLSDKDIKFEDWDNNEKDLGTLIMKKQLYENRGLAKRVDRSHIKDLKYNWKGIGSGGELYLHIENSEELGVGGNLITEAVEGFGYKVIPDEYKGEIKTRLKGTFYSNSQGKVYYEPNKPLTGVKDLATAPNCESADLLSYEFDKDTGTIIKYKGSSLYVIIPESFLVDGKCIPVRVIGKGAFQRGSFPRDYAIKEVIIPPGLEKIEEDAFRDNEIIEIVIPSGVTEVASGAFIGNNVSPGGLVIKGPEGSGGIHINAFNPGVTPIYKPVTNTDLGISLKPKVDKGGQIIKSPSGRPTASISSGGNWANSGSQGGYNSGTSGGSGNSSSSSSGNPDNSSTNKVIIIPDVVEIDGVEVEIVEVDQGAFQGLGIIQATLPSGLERIEDYAFAGNQLIGVEIPEQVKHIGNFAFAYNEIPTDKDYQWTIGYIKFKKDIQVNQVSKVNKIGNIEVEGKKAGNLLGASLLDNIFLTSKGNVIISEDYNPGIIPPLTIETITKGYLHSGVNIELGYKFSEEILDEEWKINGEIINGKPNRKFQEGTHNIQVRVLTKKAWSKWFSKNLVVNKEPFSVTQSGKYMGYDWIVPETGIYKFTVSGARGGSGGSGRNCGKSGYSGSAGSQITGEIYLEKDTIIKIHTGNSGGSGSNNSNWNGGDGGNGGSGGYSSIRIDNTVLIMARGGSGGGGGVSCGMGGSASSGSSGLPGSGSNLIDKSVKNAVTTSGSSGYVKIEQIIIQE